LRPATYELRDRQRPRLMTALSPIRDSRASTARRTQTETARQFLAACGLVLSPSQVNDVWRLTGEGHPKALELLAARQDFACRRLGRELPCVPGGLRVEWLPPIVDDLPADQRALVIDLSVFDRSIPEAASAQLFPSWAWNPCCHGCCSSCFCSCYSSEVSYC
jgi:hypothetical protein